VTRPIVPIQSGIVQEAVADLIQSITDAVPQIVAGLIFLVVAAIIVRIVMTLVRALLERALPGEAPVYRQFIATLVAVFLWFAVGLGFLSALGLEQVAASLGTAAGFIALGVSYALSNMIADAVAGVYLLRDPDFNPGDEVTVDGTTGTVQTIELRKTRFAVEGDTLVRGNAEIEKRWRKEGEPAASQQSPPAD
jgi:small-conductance mechanosensitive channel